MSNSREVSQFSNFIVVDDSNRNIGIATTATPYVGIGTTNPQYKLDVVGDLNFTGTLRQNGSEYSSGIQNVVEDTTPQLGGNLDLNGKTIDGTGGVNITGVVTATSFTGNLTGTASTTTNIPNLTGDVISNGTVTSIASGVIVNDDINASAGIVDTKLATISTAGKVSNSATTATNANTASAIVARDGSGNFSAGTITANLTGTATTATNVTVTTSTTNSAFKVPFANTTANTTGNYGLLQDSTATFTYNPSTDTLVAGTFSGSGASLTSLSATNISTGTLAIARGGTNSTATPTNGGVSYGTGTAFAFTSAGTLGQILQSSGAGAPVWSSNLNVSGISTLGVTSTTNLTAQQLNVSGVSTIANLRVTPVGTGATVGSVGVVTYYGDGSQLTGVSAAGYQFNVGITSIVSAQLTGVGSNVLTLPSTSGKRYIIHSINASNVAAGNTDVNVIGAFDFSGGERSYFAYNVPIPTGTSVELLRQPQVLNPSDVIVMRGTDYNRDGSDDAVQVYISYEVKDDTNYFGVGVGTVGIAVTDPTTIYTSTTYPSVLQSIRLVNRTDSGGYPVSVTITSGVTTTYLIDDLIVPKYGSVEILDTPKALTTNDTIQVIVDQTETIDVQISGIKVV